jgi:flagella basal body P-ring formation protein FlgA
MHRLRHCLLLLSALSIAPPGHAAERLQSIDAVRRAAAALVSAQLGDGATRAIVTPAELDARLRLVPCGTPLAASLPRGSTLRARVTVTVACRTAGWTVYVPVDVEVELPVLVLQKPVAAGARLGAVDVVAGTRRVSGVFSEFVPDAAALAGQHVRRPLAAGTVLVADMLAPDALVVRGQQVTLVASLGGLEVRAPGRVMTDAAAATRVRVQNLSSQRIGEGVVESADTVRVAP